jgi:hypothetical protein
MKKTFQLTDPQNRHKPARVIEQVKSDVRKYLKRERRKELPEEVDFWDFDCRTGKEVEAATETHVSEINTAIDGAAKESWPAIFIEILAKPGHRAKKPKAETKVGPDPDGG